MGGKTVLTTRRLRLRTWRRSDWREYHSHCNTDAVMHWLGGTVTPRQVQREADWNMRHQDRYGFSFWVVERKRDAALMGFCGLIRVGEVGSPIRGRLEIGWRVRADMWRMGYALEAASATISWISALLPREAIFARIHVHNEASAALAMRLGLERVPGSTHRHHLDLTPLDLFVLTPR